MMVCYIQVPQISQDSVGVLKYSFQKIERTRHFVNKSLEAV